MGLRGEKGYGVQKRSSFSQSYQTALIYHSLSSTCSLCIFLFVFVGFFCLLVGFGVFFFHGFVLFFYS